MRIQITNFDDDAMKEDRNGETICVLQKIIDNIMEYGVPNCDGMRLVDTNGNSIGFVSVSFTEDDDDDDDDDDGYEDDDDDDESDL